MATAHDANEARGRCMCGKVGFVAAFPSRFCCHCHCASCRRSHSAAVVTWIGFPASQVKVVAGPSELAYYESSPGTQRAFCRACGTKLFFESARWPGEIHVPLAAFDDPVDREPAGDTYLEEHAAWMPWPASR